MSFTIAAAQIPSTKGNIAANCKAHMRAVVQAHSHEVNCIVFPELSLTGYEPSLAAELALKVNDPCFVLLAQQARRYQMTIIVGAPVDHDGLPFIGAFIIQPTGKIHLYRKQFLHQGEEASFSPGNEHCVIEVGSDAQTKFRLLNAICADTTHPEHAAACAVLEASIYAAGVLITDAGYSRDAEQLAGYAREHNLLVVMANHCAQTGGYLPAGKSAIWQRQGLVASADGLEPCLVIATQEADGWQGRCVALAIE